MSRQTDFYQTTPRPYCGAKLPTEPLDRLLPRPQQLRSSGAAVRLAADADASTLKLDADPSAGEAVVSWLRSELRRRLDVDLEKTDGAGAGVELHLVSTGSSTVVEIPTEVALPDHPEGYALRTTGGPATARLQVFARTPTGILHAAATILQLLRRNEAGAIEAPVVTISDWPAIELRVLGGWALCRGHRLREAVDLACSVKANRVLYNWWGWIPGDPAWNEDRYLVDYARQRGVELVCELRRMSFGKDYRISDPQQRDRILTVYEQAADAGFRCFGLLFDDVAWESPEEECRLATAVYERLRDRLGRAPEFYCCPQYYWYPGQMALSWTGGADPQETAVQRAYLGTYGSRLPAAIHLYLANFWADVPRDYQEGLRRGFTDLVGRQPVFFDNQLINDYRLGVILPFALQQRPADFGRHVAGYLINAPRPLAANAAAVATSLAYAWNTEDYDPEQALGAALHWQHGDRAAAVVSALNRLIALANAWADRTYTATNHYTTLWRQVREGRAERDTFEQWRHDLHAVRRDGLDALRTPLRTRPEFTRGLHQLLVSIDRLESDLDLFDAYLRARERLARDDRDGAGTLKAFRRKAAEVRRTAVDTVVEFLPPLPDLQPLVAGADGTRSSEDLAPTDSQAWSWVEYFYRNTERKLDGVIAEMTAALDELAGL